MKGIDGYDEFVARLDALSDFDDASSIRRDIIKALNKHVGETVNYSQLNSIMQKVNNGSKGAIAEAWVVKKIKSIVTAHPSLDLSGFGDLFKNKNRIPDGIFRVKDNGTLVIYDVKAGYVDGAIDPKQLEDYATMVEILSSKQNRSHMDFVELLESKGVDMKNFNGSVEMRYIVMPGGTDEVVKAVTNIEKTIANAKIEPAIREKIKVFNGSNEACYK